MFLFYNFCAFLSLRLPRGCSLVLVRVLSFLRYLTTPVLRRRVRANYETVMAAAGREGESVERLVREAYYNFGLYLREFMIIPRLDKAGLAGCLTVRGRENLDGAFRHGRGAISLTAHLGNWELAGVFTSLLGYPISAVALSHPSGPVNRFFVRRREMKGVRVALLGRQAKKIVSALRRNELVALLGDRVFSPPVVHVPLFGRPAPLPAGPALLARRMNCPVVPGFLVREGDRFVLSFETPIFPDQALPEQESVRVVTARYAACLEEYIRRTPAQWLVFDRVWRKTAPAA